MRCLLCLAEQGKGSTLTIPEMSETEGISEAYAGKLLRILRRAGFVKASRGKIGGYALAKPADEILVGDVMNVLDSPLFEGGFCESHSGQVDTCVRSTDCSLRGLWHAVQVAVDEVLRKTTLADLLCHEQQLFVWAKGQGASGSFQVRTTQN